MDLIGTLFKIKCRPTWNGLNGQPKHWNVVRMRQVGMYSRETEVGPTSFGHKRGRPEYVMLINYTTAV